MNTFSEDERAPMTYERIFDYKFILDKAFIPTLVPDIPQQVKDLLLSCLGSTRPSMDQICHILKRLNPAKRGIVDVMMYTMENYLEDLEEKVEERTVELQEV